jgi:hypothetical protein
MVIDYIQEGFFGDEGRDDLGLFRFLVFDCLINGRSLACFGLDVHGIHGSLVFVGIK